MKGRNFEKVRQQRMMRERGSEPADGGWPQIGAPRPGKMSKSEMRALAEKLITPETQIKSPHLCQNCGFPFLRTRGIADPAWHPHPCPRCGEMLS